MVINTKRDTGDGDGTGRGGRDLGPSGEVTTLSKLSVKVLQSKMGDRAQADTSELKARIEQRDKKKRDRLSEKVQFETKKKARKEDSTSSLEAGLYQPQHRDTRAAYEVLLTFVSEEMGDKSHDVLRSAADEVISLLKDESLKMTTKKKEIDQLFRRARPMEDERFSRLVNIGKKITDYIDTKTLDKELEDSKSMMSTEHHVPLEVVEESEEEEGNNDEIRDMDSDDDEEVGKKEVKEVTIKTVEVDNMADADDGDTGLNPRSIDAFWIQREVSKYYKEALTSQKMSEDVLALLGEGELSARDCENKLVLLFEYDKFDFIKLLLKNRLKIVYCTRLARAADETAKAAIREEMSTNPKLRPILDALTEIGKQQDLNMGLIKEARSLKAKSEKDVLSINNAVFWNKRPKAILDFDTLSFSNQGHHMSNEECKLPKGSEIINKKGSQEIHIPALKPRELAEGERLVAISSMPEWAQRGFEGMQTLNRVQTKVFPIAFKTPENMLVCAPTGAGKTNVAMLAILREIGLHRKEDGSIDKEAFKIVYIAPMKSLVQEMVLSFSNRLRPYGIEVKELSGDQQLTKEQITNTQVIVTTPEKWDIITRKAGDRTYTQLVRLIIIDEVHLLHDGRGPVLESIVSRSIRQIESTQDLIRLVGLSATLPNYEDVALFLRVKPDKGLFFFDNSYRPVPLQQQFIGVNQKKAFKRHQMMNQITYEKVLAQAKAGNNVLVFVHSRKETYTTARELRNMAMESDESHTFVAEDSGRKEMLTDEAEKVSHEGLKELLPCGFAIHHAGMTRKDRETVEELFADNHLRVLVSTATLAWGVNLPARTVIIKGTQVYSPEKGEWVELSPMDVMQMLGRAGRPQYDTKGEGIIITTQKELPYYLSLLNEQLPIESQFVSKLADNLNAEIVMGAVQNVKEAIDWLGYTYLYVRMLRRPQLYKISAEEIKADPILEQRRIDLIHTAADMLDKNSLIKYDRKAGNFQVTDLGRVASHYYLTFQSVNVFNEYLKPTMSDIDIFRVFSLASEFKHMNVREEEKQELAKLLDKVPIPIKESMEEASAKVNVLLQAYISRLGLEGFALISDMVYITQSAGRIMRALFEIVLKRGWAAAALKTLNLCKMIDHRMWGVQSPLRQFPSIPPDVIKRIEGKDFPWERFYDLEAHALGELVRFPKMGKQLHKCVHQLPNLDLQGNVQPITRSLLKVELTITPDFQFDEKVHGNVESFWILVEDVNGENILHYQYFLLKSKYKSEEHSVSFTIPISDPLPPQYFIRVVSDRWLGSEVVLPISFRHLLLPEKFPPPTELLDLQALPVTELANEKYINYYSNNFDYFNAIQTQCFKTVFKTDDSVFIGAPTGSGKTVLAELAIMRAISRDSKAKCVYVAPLEALVEERYRDWQSRFLPLNIAVTKLTGETTADLKLLQQGQVVLSTPENWDILSRRWKTRKNVQIVKLFIVDELHLIVGSVGPVLEVIVSRMRYIASQTTQPIRIVALSNSVANARDLGEWIGASNNAIFAFHPNVRPVPLEKRVQGFDIPNFAARQLAMVKPAFLTIKHHSKDKPVIVFVASRKTAREVAVDFMTFLDAEPEEGGVKFLHADMKELQPHLANVQNKTLKETLQAGIGFYHAGLTEVERAVVQRLFAAGAIQVVVSEYALCWGMTMASHMVIIMDTQVFDGREHRYVDCPIADICQMMGRASRPLVDSSGKCVLFCESSKKEYLTTFLSEPFPVESHLDQALADHMNAEIITKRIESPNEAVHYLTWSFFYRRLTQNPNYYNLQGVSHRHLSDHLSELVERTIEDLVASKCIALDEDELSALNLGMIAAYYYIKYTTVELFSSGLKSKIKLNGLLEVLCSASEFDHVQVRHREDYALKRTAKHLPLPINNPGNFNEPHVKTNVLLQAHFSRIELSAAAKSDQEAIVPDASRLLQAMVDVLGSNGWLLPALAAMELSQMVTQGMWNTDSPLLQLPHVTSKTVQKLHEANVKTIADVMELEDDQRIELLGLSAAKMDQVATFCNAYPNLDVKYDSKEVKAGSKCAVTVTLTRDEDEDAQGVPKVVSARFPQVKAEGWWLVLGDPTKNEMLSIKRVFMKDDTMQIPLDFTAPKAGRYSYKIYLMSDSYIGCDQEFTLDMNVTEGSAMDVDESGSEEDSS